MVKSISNTGSQNEILQYALENGMIDISYVQEQIEMIKREEILSKHPYHIWYGENDHYWHTYLPDEQRGRIPKKRKSEEDLKDDIVNYWMTEGTNPTIAEVFQEWNDRRLSLKQISPSTHLRNRQIFNRHFKKLGNSKIKSITQQDVEDFLEHQIPEHELTSKAFSNLKGVTRGFLKRAKRRKLISFNVEEIFTELDTSDNEFKKTIKEDYEEVFDEEETATMIDYIIENIDIMNLGIALMFVTGVRIGELVTLKHEDIVANTINIRRTETRYVGEDGKYVYEVKEFPKTAAGVRTIVVPDQHLWLLKRLKMSNMFGEFIFVKGSKRITTPALRMRLKRICKKLNIYHKSPHKIRRTYGSILLDNNVDKRLILSQMGHADILCTENHYHRNRKSLAKKSQIISGIPEFGVLRSN